MADMTDLPYPDEYFDFVVSAEVLEHVNDHRRALAETARVLTKAGGFVLQCPYSHDYSRTDYRTHRWRGRDVHLQEPIYHAEETLVYQVFGRDLHDHLKAAGFTVAYVRLQVPKYAISPQDLFLATKASFLDVSGLTPGRLVG